MKVLVTGGTGFVGRSTIPVLEAAGHEVHAPNRAATGDIGPDTDWTVHLGGVDAVVHLAARAHVMRDTATDPLAAFRRINVAGTARLMDAAQAAGAGRFVFLSSIKVNGEQGQRPFTAADAPSPQDAYGISKQEAERTLLSRADGIDVVILRPPLVYGPGVRGNFRSLMRWVDRRLPLPLATIRNRRSLIGTTNLASAILWALDGPPGTFLPSDGEDLSTPDLVRRLAAALGRTALLFPFPVSCLRRAGRLTGRTGAIDRLTGSLTVDNALPGWSPPAGLDQDLLAAAEWFRRGDS